VQRNWHGGLWRVASESPPENCELALAPVAFDPDIASVAMIPAAWDPAGVGMRRGNVLTRNPDVGMTVPAMVAGMPDPVAVLRG
jgi:hypothetical protein